MGPCIIMLQHEVMVVDEWHNNWPQDLVTVSLCIQNAINQMHLCSLSITYACPYHNPTATMGHSIHNVTSANRSPTRRHTHCLLSALYSENQDSSVKRTPLQSARRHLNVSICSHKSVKTTNCSQVKTLMRMTSMKMSFPETVSDSLGRNYLVMQTDCCSSCPCG